MNLLSYDEIFRASLIGLLFATSVVPGYFFMSIPQNKHIAHLVEALNWKNTTALSD